MAVQCAGNVIGLVLQYTREEQAMRSVGSDPPRLYFSPFTLQVSIDERVTFKKYKIRRNLHVGARGTKPLILFFILENMSLPFT